MPARTSQTTAKTAGAAKAAKALKKPTASTASGGVNKRKQTLPQRRVVIKKSAGATGPKNGETKVLVARRKQRRIPQAEQLRRKTLREMKLAGASPKNRAIRLLPFKMLVKEIMRKQPGGEGLRIQTGAVDALLEMAEAYVIQVFKHTEMVASRCGRPTIMADDMKLARTIANDPLDRGGQRTLSWTEEFANEWKLHNKEVAAEKAAKAAKEAAGGGGEDEDEEEGPTPAVDDADDDDYESTSDEDEADEEEEDEDDDEVNL